MQKVKIVTPEAAKFTEQLGVSKERMDEIVEKFSIPFANVMADGLGQTGLLVDMPRLLAEASNVIENEQEFAALIIFLFRKLMEMKNNPMMAMVSTLFGNATVDEKVAAFKKEGKI